MLEVRVTVVRRAIGGVLAAILATTGTAAVAAAAPAPAAGDEPIVVDGVVRDNVDNAHSPKMTDELIKEGVGTARVSAAEVQGIDIASHQHPNNAAINWSQVAGAGFRFAGIKSTEGDYYQNPYYVGDRANASTAGLYTFAYHFAIPNVSGGAAQADYMLNQAGYRQDGHTLPPALDVEANPYSDDDGTNACYGLTQAQMVTWIRDFVNQVKRRTGTDAIIYTAASWWRDCTGGSSAFASYPLWVASYAATPNMPAGWSDYTLWQYTSTGPVSGIASPNTDRNYVRGGEATLDELATQASEPSGYTAADPVRVLDTRNAIGTSTRTPLGAGGSVTLDLSGRLPATATGVVLNVTAITTSASFVTVWPNGSPRPGVSNLNVGADEIRSNLVTVQVPPDRKIRLFNNSGSTHVLADLAGWYATDAAGLHTPLASQRVLDTRAGGGAPIGQAATYTLNLSAAVPADATAVTLNLTGVNSSRATYISAWPTGQPRPDVSNLNLKGVEPTPILATVKLGADQSVNFYNNSGTIHLLVDVAGYYSPSSGSKFVAVAPRRLLDTRSNPVTWVPATGGGSAVTLDTYGQPGTTGSVVNVTGVGPSTSTFVAVIPKTSPTPTRPNSSNLNLVAGQTVSNLVSTAVSPTSQLWLYNGFGSVNLIADLAGYFVP
jgi:GH25 family lysozyme M1 (1,4-beta-N-acetylmuramidase)